MDVLIERNQGLSGSAELSRFKDSIFDSGFLNYLLKNTVSFGIVKNDSKTDIPYFRVNIDDIGLKTVKIAPGYAIASGAKLIKNPVEVEIGRAHV